MEDQIIDVAVINALIKKNPQGIALSKFENINSLVNGKTIVAMIYDLREFDIRILSMFNNTKIIYDNLRTNINKLLSHPDIDFSEVANKKVLKLMMIVSHSEHLYMNSETLDKILEHHKLNPDDICGRNSIAELLSYRLQKTDTIEKIKIFIKNGANIELNCDTSYCYAQPYAIAKRHPIMFNIVLQHTKNFYCLGDTFSFFKLPNSSNIDYPTIIQIFEHILQYGKISSLQYLYKKEYQNIKEFNEWIRNIKIYQNLDIEAARICFNSPINKFELINQNKDVDNIVRKMCIFRLNLECLAKNIITVPAYRFYDVAIILYFLMKNPHLTVLSRDILRLIAFFVFNF